MIPIPPDCSTSPGKIIVCDDPGSRPCMRFTNADGARRIKVDGCVLKNERACDYLVVALDGREHFVEIKGNKVEHACDQLEATIPKMSERLSSKKEIWCFVVSTESPRTSTKTQQRKEQFKKKFNARLIVKTGMGEHTL